MAPTRIRTTTQAPARSRSRSVSGDVLPPGLRVDRLIACEATLCLRAARHAPRSSQLPSAVTLPASLGDSCMYCLHNRLTTATNPCPVPTAGKYNSWQCGDAPGAFTAIVDLTTVRPDGSSERRAAKVVALLNTPPSLAPASASGVGAMRECSRPCGATPLRLSFPPLPAPLSAPPPTPFCQPPSSPQASRVPCASTARCT